MGRKCCVTNCNGNYDKDTKVATFRLPQDAAEKERWIKAIPRDNIPDSNNTVVCERYWPKNYATSKYRGKDRPIDPPSIIDCVKPSLVLTPLATLSSIVKPNALMPKKEIFYLMKLKFLMKKTKLLVFYH